jgi:serine/threonine protein kinase
MSNPHFALKDDIVTQLTVASRNYLIEGLMGRGQHADVYFARWDSPTPELVVIKLGCVEEGFAWMKREYNTLVSLHASTREDAEFYTFFIPKPLCFTHVEDLEGQNRPVAVYKYRNLFDWSLEDIKLAYPDGVCERTVVWMWRRILQLLQFVHASGSVHGALLPSHIIINAPNHGGALVGWSACVRRGQEITLIDERQRDFYPSFRTDEQALIASRELDLYMLARCMIWIVGGDVRTGQLPRTVPRKLATLLRDAAGFGQNPLGVPLGAMEMSLQVKQVAREVFGPAAFVPLPLPRSSEQH